MRAQVKNQLQHLALNQGVRRKHRLWAREGRRMLEQLPLSRWTARRRAELLEMLDRLDRQVGELDQAVGAEAERRPEVQLLMTHPGVGPVVGLAYVLTIGPVDRFPRGKQVASYLGLIPSEKSSGGRQRLGAISKQGNTMMRTLLVEAAQTASRFDQELRREYRRLAVRKHTLSPRSWWRASWPCGCTGCCARTERMRRVRSLRCRAARVIPWSQDETDCLSGHPASLGYEGV